MSEKSVAQRAAEVVEHSQRALVRGDVEGYVACFAPFPVERSVALLATMHFVTRHGKEATMQSIDVFELNEDFKIYKGQAYWDVEKFSKLLLE